MPFWAISIALTLLRFTRDNAAFMTVQKIPPIRSDPAEMRIEPLTDIGVPRRLSQEPAFHSSSFLIRRIVP
jgi:hypothetical protein